jgi:hypothetical protein
MGGIKPIETLYRGYRFRSRLEARWAVFFDVAGISWRYEVEGFDLSAVPLPKSTLPEPGLEHAQAIGPDAPPIRYLPDFFLPEQEAWVEIKPEKPTVWEVQVMKRLVWGTGQDGYIFWDLRPTSEIPPPSTEIPNLIEDFRGFYGESALGVRVYEDALKTYYPDLPNLRYRALSGRMEGFRIEEPGPHLSVHGNYQWCECPRCHALGLAVGGAVGELECGCFPPQTGMTPPPDNPAPTNDTPRLMRAYMAARQARFEYHENPEVYVLQSKLERIREVLDSDDS